MPRPRPSAHSARTAAPRAASNTPATSAALGRRVTNATSAAPVTATASAVVERHRILAAEAQNGGGPREPGRHHGQAYATHSRPPAIVIASSARSVRDGVSAGRQARQKAGPRARPRGTGSVWFPARISMTPAPRAGQKRHEAIRPGGTSAMNKMHRPACLTGPREP